MVALTLVWRVIPAGSPPLYDGQCIAQPYATLGGSPAAQPATKTFPQAATFPASELFTGETPPQAQLLMQAGTFDNSTALTLSITPVTPPAVKPPNGSVEGNVYRFSMVTANGTEVEPSARLPAFVVLRGTRSIPAPVVDRFNGTAWTPLTTVNAGCGNTFEATTALLGDFAAVAAAGSSPASGSGGGIPGAAIIGALAVLLIIAVVVLFSLDRKRGRPG